MEEHKRALSLLPERLRLAAEGCVHDKVEEFRLRLGREPVFLAAGTETSFSEQTVTAEELECILERATGASMHAAAQAMREGYISFEGLRIGVCGTVLHRAGKMEGFQTVSSLAIRISRECKGMCERVITQLYSLSFQNTLIVSPPGGGKTTALRDMIRGLSERGYRLGVVDERNELSATQGAAARFDLGPCADILIGLNKAEASMLLLRTMNPQIIAMDEITHEADGYAVEQITGCGVRLLATAHAADAGELYRRPLYRRLLETHCFHYVLTVRQSAGKRNLSVERLEP